MENEILELKQEIIKLNEKLEQLQKKYDEVKNIVDELNSYDLDTIESTITQLIELHPSLL